MTTAAAPRVVRGGRSVVVAAVTLLLVLAHLGAAVAAGDPYRPQQWFLDRIGAPTAWSSAQGAGQVIAIVDSGVALQHPDLRGRFIRTDDGAVFGRDFVDEDAVPQDGHGHGTMVAGIAAATRGNDEGGVGTAPRARLLPVRVLDDRGRGNEADVEAGIRWAVDNGATVINLSLESAIQAGEARLPVGVSAPTDAVEYAWEHGVIVVAAAGNSGSPFTDYPRSSPVVLVGSTDRDDERTSFSDAGRDDIVMAPGVDIVSTWCRKDGDSRCTQGTATYGQASGTSFSAPQVAAGLTLLRQLGLSAEQAVNRLRSTTQDLGPQGPDTQYGVGLLDLASAVETARAAGTTSSKPEPGTSSSSASRNEIPSSTRPDEPAQTSPSPHPSPEPTPTVTPTPSPSRGATTEPTADVTVIPNDQVAAPEPGRPLDPARTGWGAAALLLLVATGILTGREFARQR